MISKSRLRKAKFSRAVKKETKSLGASSEKRSFQELIQKNEVFHKKFWVTFSKVTIRHGACTAICSRAAGTERLRTERFALAAQLGSSAVAHISMPKGNRQRGFGA
ncbi:MAG: hypothetical protein RSA94_06020, partial [Mucinivorans sp.]